MFTQHVRQRDALIEGILQKVGDAEGLLPVKLPNTERFSRSLMGGVSYVTKFLFGIPSEDDFRKVSAQISTLADGINNQGKILRDVKDGFVLMENVTSHRLNMLEDQQLASLTRFNSLIDELKTWRERLRRSLQDAQVTARALTDMVGFVSQIGQLTSSEVLFLSTLEGEAVQYLQSIQTLIGGRVPEGMVEPRVMANALEVIRKKLLATAGQIITNTDVTYYYKHRLALSVHNENYIIINVKIPISFAQTNMILYQVESHFVPLNGSFQAGTTRIADLAPFLVVSKDGSYFAELSKSEVDNCLPNHCHVTFPLSPVDKPTCAMALYNSNSKLIDKNCNIAYHRVESPEDFIQDLGHGYWLVSSSISWLMTCRGLPPRETPACALCVVQLPCLCSLHSKRFTVSPSAGLCDRGNVSSTMVAYPVNMAVLHSFYDPS